MTPGKIKLVAKFYLDHLVHAGVVPERTDKKLPRAAWCANEIISMTTRLEGEFQQRPDLREIFQDEKETIDALTKIHRWLGFIQGVLFAKDVFDVDDLRDHSRKDSPISSLNESMINDQKVFTEKERRIYYQDIVYAVCNQLERIYPQKIVCGTVEMPTNEVQETMTRLADTWCNNDC